MISLFGLARRAFSSAICMGSMAILSACGGGSDDAANGSVAPPAALGSQEPWAEQADLPSEQSEAHAGTGRKAAQGASRDALADSGAQALVEEDFEETFPDRTAGWTVNYWGTDTKFAVWREARPGNAFSGKAAQGFRVNARSNGDAHLIYPHGFLNGRTYRLSLRLKASAPMSATVQLRRDAFPWNAFAVRTVELTTQWQRVELEGTYQWLEAGSLRLLAGSTGVDLYVDDVSLSLLPASSPAGSLALPASGDTSVTSTPLFSSDMEGDYTWTAAGWTVNQWGLPSLSAGRAAAPGQAHGGLSSQRFRLDSKGRGDAHLIRRYAFAQGKTYRATFFLRSDSPADVELAMRRDAHPWQPFAIRTLKAGPAWQKVTITGTATGAGSLRIQPVTLGVNLYIDDVLLETVQSNELRPVLPDAIPDTFFGMHFLELGRHNAWPQLGQKVVRLWDTGTTWRNLKPDAGPWNWSSTAGQRLDYYVNHVLKHDPQAVLLYTMGQTPRWASRTPDKSALYGPGASGEPVSMADWRDYVRTLAQRYAGRIRHWELWNESDFEESYSGSVAAMVEMARIAREELKKADPENQLISPGLSAGEGMVWLDRFLAAGGGQHVDVFAYHWYLGAQPENLAPRMRNLRRLLAQYGQDHKPLWNTEGAPGCDPIANVDCEEPSEAHQGSIMLRAMLTMWASGISNFNYYFWESRLPARALTEVGYATPTLAGRAYAQAVGRLRGARVVDAYEHEGRVMVFRMARGREPFVVLWARQEGTVVSLPAAWSVGRQRKLMGEESAIPASGVVTLGVEPLILQP